MLTVEEIFILAGKAQWEWFPGSCCHAAGAGKHGNVLQGERGFLHLTHLSKTYGKCFCSCWANATLPKLKFFSAAWESWKIHNARYSKSDWVVEGSLQGLKSLIIFLEGLLSPYILNFRLRPWVLKRQLQTLVLFLPLPYISSLRSGDYCLLIQDTLFLYFFCGYVFLKHPSEISVPIICSLDCERKVMSLGKLFLYHCSLLLQYRTFSGKRTCFCLADSAEASFSS